MTTAGAMAALTRREDPLAPLIGGALDRDPTALRRLLDAVAPDALRVVQLIVGAGAADADDLTQEALLGLLRALPDYRGECTVRRYARRIAARVAMTNRRRARRRSPLRAEREWFMRHTEELRHRLEAEHRQRELAAALSRLRGRVVGIWAITRRSPAARRARIFALWDEMAEDEPGREARRILIEAVREILPAGSEDAFSEEELRRLNASRESREPFSPY